MKPIIIIKETNKNGKFEFTEQELKDLIEKVYEQGVADGNGNPIPYCSGGTASDPKDNRATLNAESNDLVYRGWERNIKFPKEAEPIPCYDTPVTCGTSSQPNPTTKLNDSTVLRGV